jgi:hypothetical protein
VERAGEGAPVVLLATAEHRALVAAGVDQRVQLTFFVTRDHDRLPADVGGEVVVVVGQLALVGEVDPVALEDVLHLQLEQFGIGERLSTSAVEPVLGIHQHRTVDLAPDFLQCFRHRRLTSVGSIALGISVAAGRTASRRTNA